MQSKNKQAENVNRYLVRKWDNVDKELMTNTIIKLRYGSQNQRDSGFIVYSEATIANNLVFHLV